MPLKLTILGCNSAIPTEERFTTSQVLSTEHKNYVIDCGEGAQIRLNQLKIKRNKIHEVFISHLHGDHCFGLPGLITSFNLSGRTIPLTIFGPVGLLKYVEVLGLIGSLHLNFELRIQEIDADESKIIFEDDDIIVQTIPLKHRIPTTGFLFKEKERNRNIDPETIQQYELTFEEIRTLKAGEDVLRENGVLLNSSDLTFVRQTTQTYAFCSDTIYDESILPFIGDVDLLYHEATYLHDLAIKARERMHSTALEAAKIAKLAGAKKLVLGHFSSRYKDLSVFLDEATQIFPNTELAVDKKVFDFNCA